MAVFLPTPGNLVKYLISLLSIAVIKPSLSAAAMMARADFGPIPETLIRRKNKAFSASLTKP